MAVYNKIEYDARVLRAAEALSASYDVTVISVASGSRYSNPLFRSRQFRLWHVKGLKSLSLFWFWLRIVVAAFIERPAVVYAHDFFLPVAGLIAARVAGARFVYDAHELIIPEPGVKKSATDWFFYWLERLSVHRADLVIAANQERAAMMKEFYGLSRLPLAIRNIPCVPPASECRGSEAVIKRYPRLRKTNHVRLVYQGDMSLARGIGTFIEAIRESSEPFELLLIGDGPDYKKIERMVQGPPSSDKIITLGRIPRSELNDLIATCDIGIVTYSNKGLNNIYCAPNKVYEYAQAGLPILTTDQPALRAIVEKYHIGVTCPCGEGTTTAEVTQCIRSLAGNPGSYEQNLERFLNDHQWVHEAEKLVGAVGELKLRK